MSSSLGPEPVDVVTACDRLAFGRAGAAAAPPLDWDRGGLRLAIEEILPK
jgi:hypothetical protein